ncbi:ComC/BlpC family leader-containing pheromone/bacteriocin [Streptococcus saliviloxodontae]|uniref:Bacteriocin n=1 Tax=Streptococcus saliviloxodontae TaxID=1349416 RepID=A0ABS2PJE5_9STRE|nr:ComC/BlpC family leader-containing pheromone/bacteriocin [Streptococcus saliviloxodontae]MBM7635554.1 hypothetical protein [Streptococcus saliviloxodontae]
MKTKQFKTLETSDLQYITGGDNESYDFWFRIGSNTRKGVIAVGKAVCRFAPFC